MADHDLKIKFDNDPRTPCKYGVGCYQKNKAHHDKYKHPSSSPEAKDDNSESPIIKKQKVNSEEPKNSVTPKERRKNDYLSPRKTPVEKKEISSSNSPKYMLLKDKTRSSDSIKLKLENDKKELIKQLFLVAMPDDFYSFWEMCESMSKDDPSNALKAIKLKLVGPFDVLAGKVTEVYEDDLPDFLKHWRFYYDPPEFQTVLACEDSRCYHMGYYRDDPKDMPVFIASSCLNSKSPEKNGELKILGQNLFAALNAYMEELKTDPFSRMKIPKFQKTLIDWAKDKGFSLEKSSKTMDSRSRKVVTKTFHGAGIVVPVDKKNDVGYRELAASNSMIKKILKGIVESKTEEERRKFWEQLQPVITFANIANDECDFGTTLELGLDLFTFGSPLLHRSARQLLCTAYNLLGRPEFAKIVEAHLDDRKEGHRLGIL